MVNEPANRGGIVLAGTRSAWRGGAMRCVDCGGIIGSAELLETIPRRD
jgi:hypothetical protein